MPCSIYAPVPWPILPRSSTNPGLLKRTKSLSGLPLISGGLEFRKSGGQIFAKCPQLSLSIRLVNQGPRLGLALGSGFWYAEEGNKYREPFCQSSESSYASISSFPSAILRPQTYETLFSTLTQPCIESPLLIMSKTSPFPFQFTDNSIVKPGKKGETTDVTITLKNVRGRIPSIQASRLRTMALEANADPGKIIAHSCSYDGLSSRLVEEAGFPIVFLAGYPVASAYGLPDTGYIAMAEMCDKIQEATRQCSIPVMADGDTGYGSPMNVRRTVECYAKAGAAGVMIEDQTWPKRMYRTCFPKALKPPVRSDEANGMLQDVVTQRANRSYRGVKRTPESKPRAMLAMKVWTSSSLLELMLSFLDGTKP